MKIVEDEDISVIEYGWAKRWLDVELSGDRWEIAICREPCKDSIESHIYHGNSCSYKWEPLLKETKGCCPNCGETIPKEIIAFAVLVSDEFL